MLSLTIIFATMFIYIIYIYYTISISHPWLLQPSLSYMHFFRIWSYFHFIILPSILFHSSHLHMVVIHVLHDTSINSFHTVPSSFHVLFMIIFHLYALSKFVAHDTETSTKRAEIMLWCSRIYSALPTDASISIHSVQRVVLLIPYHIKFMLLLLALKLSISFLSCILLWHSFPTRSTLDVINNWFTYNIEVFLSFNLLILLFIIGLLSLVHESQELYSRGHLLFHTCLSI